MRLLLVTGSMGAGHHAAARAVEESARRVWPGVETTWTETLGDHSGPVFRAIYAGCVRHLPWLYELYFQLLWRAPFFRAGTRAVIGRQFGRRLAPVLESVRPDLVVAVFPEGITGLAWLRRRGRAPMTTVALVTDPAPHPLWVSACLDLHLVSTELGARWAERAAPGAAVRVAALPVVSAFTPPAADTPREADPGAPGSAVAAGRGARQRPLALVSCGSLAFGDVEAICRGAVDGGADVLVSAGRVASSARRLRGVAGVTVVDWIDDPAAATRGCDLVITNGGGATALEALSCARPLVLADPIPGHGRANAAVLAGEGLARVAHGRAGVAAAVRALTVPEEHAVVEETLRRRREQTDLDADLATLPRRREDPGPPVEPPPRWFRFAWGRPGAASGRFSRVRAQDALFLHASTAAVPQQVGARIMVSGAPAGGWPAALAALVRARGPENPLLNRVLAPVRPGRPLYWQHVPAPDPALHVRQAVWEIGTDVPDWDAATTAFFADAVDPAVGWELQVAHDPATGDHAVLARVHHALGDGLAVTDRLIRLLTDEAAPSPTTRAVGVVPPRRPRDARRPDARDALATPARDRGAPRVARLGTAIRGRAPAVRHALTVVRGIASLAVQRPAGRSPLVGVSRPAPRRLSVTLDGAEVRRVARAHGVGTTVVVLAALAQTLHEELHTPPRTRAMVPLTTRTRAGTGSRADGNRTAAVSLDLPTGPMTPSARVAAVDRALANGSAAGQPEGAAAVLTGLGLLPGRVQAPLVRLVYGRRFFHLLASVMPGARRPLHLRGGRITQVLPVLPLADGVGLAVGALHWGRFTCVGITADTAVVPDIGGIPAGVARSLRSMHPGGVHGG